MRELLDERQQLDACGHDGPWSVVGHICARGRGGYHVQIVRCQHDGCEREYLVEQRR